MVEYTKIEFKIKINNTWVDKSEYVQLPISITETMDDTMDRGEVILNFTNDSEEYEAYSDVVLIIESTNGSNKYDMIIQKDTVEEWNSGQISYFKHNITLIEATHKLTTVVLNDFSITQPAESFGFNEYADFVKVKWVENNTILPTVENSLSFLDSVDEDTFRQWRTTGIAPTRYQDSNLIGRSWLQGIHSFQIDYEFIRFKKQYYSTDDYINVPTLPEATAVPFFMSRLFIPFTILDNGPRLKLNFQENLYRIDNSGNTIGDYTNQININRRILLRNIPAGKYRYYIKSTSDDNNVRWWFNNYNSQFYNTNVNTRPNYFTDVPTNVEFIVGNVPLNLAEAVGGIKQADTIYEFYYEFEVLDSVQVSQNTIYIPQVLDKVLNSISPRKLNDARYYRVATIDDLVDNTGYVDWATNNFSEYQLYASIDGIISKFGDATNYYLGNILGVYYSNPSFPEDDTGFQVVVASKITDGLVDFTDYDLSFDSNAYYTKERNYYYDQNVISAFKDIKSIDYRFVGGKNLLEVLLEVGKAFDGIPRVKFDDDLNPYITFDILGNYVKDSSFFQTESEHLSTIESNTDNHTTSVISTLENVIIDDNGNESLDTVFYPSKNTWAKVRSENFNDAVLTLGNQALCIDDPNHGIYRVVRLKVRNVIRDDYTAVQEPEGGIDISGYVYEKTIYDTLEPSNVEKKMGQQGKALYYERGKNQILNIGKIFDKDVLFGLNGETNVIENIIMDYFDWFSVGINQIVSYVNVAGRLKPSLEFEYQLEYVPMFNSTRLKIEQSNKVDEKINTTMTYSQDERNVSMSQFGKSSDRILKRSGINSVSKSYVLGNLDTIPQIGEKIVKNNIKYYADVITVSYDNSVIRAEVSYSKNYNKTDKLVGFRKNYREYEIAQDNFVWKRLNMENYVYVDTSIYQDNVFDNKKVIFPLSIKDIFTNAEGASVERITGALLNFTDLDGKPLKYLSDRDNNSIPEEYTIKNININMVPSYSNTSLIFTASAYDNFAFGRRTQKIRYDGSIIDDPEDTPSQDWLRYTVDQAERLFIEDRDNDDFEDNRKRQFAVRYTDDFGRMGVMRLMFLKESDTTFNADYFPEFYELPQQQGELFYNPYINFIEFQDKSVLDELYLIDKDSREALQFTYQVHFQSRNKDIDIRSALLKYSRLFNDELNLQSGRIIAVGVEDVDSLKDEAFYNYESSDVLKNLNGQTHYFNPSWNSSGKYLEVPAFNTVFTKAYEGYAWVYELTGEIVMVHTLPRNPGTIQIPSVFFNFTENQK
jgi:hypothetical protein